MKNVTVTLDEDVAHWARVRAAESDRSLSRYLGELLSEQMQEEQGYEAAKMRYRSRPVQSLKAPEDDYPRREELHERGLR